MRKHIVISLIMALLLPFAANAQTSLKGKVADKSGAVVGAMVLDKTTGKWATSDLDGNFTLDGASKGNTLEITCLGYTTKTIQWDGSQPLAITLEDDSLELEETVVIGYGSVKKKDLTGSVGVVSSARIEQQSATNLSQSLQGAVPGLTVTRSSSMPGASATIRVRGITSITDSSPLIIVDGMPVNSIDNVSMDDVDQITVLKDAAAASIYGARAAAGVILITTKSAREGDVMIRYNGEYSMITATEWAEYLSDPINYMTMFNEYKWNDAGNPAGGDYQQYAQDYIENYFANNAMDPIEYPNFDWKDAILRNYSTRQKHSISMAYGNKVVKSRVSASYENTDALYQGSNYERVMARMRNNFNISKRLSGDFDISLKHGVKTDPQTTPIQAANMYPSIYLGLYPDGRIGPSKSGSNTLAVIRDGGSVTSRNDYITGKVSLSFKPFTGMDITGSVTPTINISKKKDFSKAIPYYDAYDTNLVLGYVSGHTTTDLTETRSDSNTLTTQLIASYEHSFRNAHNLNLMAGYEGYTYFVESMSGSSTDMTLSNFPYLNLANNDNLAVSGNANHNAYESFFGRFMYNYRNRYYVQLNARADASSRFAKEYRWGFFPSASFGWVVSNEGFMKNVTPVSYLKFRASVGTLGNEQIGYYPYQSNIGFNSAIMYDANGAITSQMTGAQGNYAVNDITWETTYTYDVGLDAAFFNNRLDLTADYYFKETRDMLLETKIPSFIGYGDPSTNAGTMYTRGWEVKLGWKDQIGDFSYAVTANLSDAKSVMGNLNGTVFLGNQIVKEGEEYYAWYGYKSTGIYRSMDEVYAAPKQLISTLTAGDIGYMDLAGATDEDGNSIPDGMISATYDKTILGSSLPHYIYGGTINLGWKNWSLGVIVNGVGKKLSRVAEYMVRPFAGQWLSAPSVLLNSDGTRNYYSLYNTDEQNAKAQYPRLSYTSSEKNNYQMSDFWLMDGSYFRVKNISLSYSVPEVAVKKLGIQGLRIYFNADDPICFDHYLKGWDPEQTTSSYIARTFTLGADIKF